MENARRVRHSGNIHAARVPATIAIGRSSPSPQRFSLFYTFGGNRAVWWVGTCFRKQTLRWCSSSSCSGVNVGESSAWKLPVQEAAVLLVSVRIRMRRKRGGYLVVADETSPREII